MTTAQSEPLELRLKWAIAQRDAARRERDNLDKSLDEAFTEMSRLREKLEEKSSEVESLFGGLLDAYYEKDALYNPHWCIETATVMLASARGAVAVEATTSPATYAAIAQAAAQTAIAIMLKHYAFVEGLVSGEALGE